MSYVSACFLLIQVACLLALPVMLTAQSSEDHEDTTAAAIHPSLQWETALASSAQDYGLDIAVDTQGNIYVVGESFASWSSPIQGFAGSCDAFVAQLDSSGSLLWNTFFGSSSRDVAEAVAVDAHRNIYVVGQSQGSWGAPLNGYAGGKQDAFVAKLNSQGTLQWSTFLGSADSDWGWDIAVDTNGDLVVLGESDAMWGVRVPTYEPHAFIAKLDEDGGLQWTTFLKSCIGFGVALDKGNNIFVAGRSRASWGAPITDHAGDGDAFAAKLDSSGTMLWNTFMGSTDFDSGFDVAVDGDGNVYVAGRSHASWGEPIHEFAGDHQDAFVARLDSQGMLQWNTFMGSLDDDGAWGIAVDMSGDVFVTGESYDWGEPNVRNAGLRDAFIVRLDRAGELQWQTFLGSSLVDNGSGIAVDEQSNVYIVGVKWNTFIRTEFGECDTFVAKWALPTASSE